MFNVGEKRGGKPEKALKKKTMPSTGFEPVERSATRNTDFSHQPSIADVSFHTHTDTHTHTHTHTPQPQPARRRCQRRSSFRVRKMLNCVVLIRGCVDVDALIC
jgi:hypothetical protein